MNLQGHPRPGPEAAALKEAVDDEGPDLLLPSPAAHPPLHPQPPLLGTTENYPEMQPSSPPAIGSVLPLRVRIKGWRIDEDTRAGDMGNSVQSSRCDFCVAKKGG